MDQGEMKNERQLKVIFWPKRLLTIDQAAHYLGIAPKTLRNRLGRKAKDKFPVKPKKQGRRRVFDIHDLDVYADGLDTVDY